jgi:hypothetical protein
MAICLNKISGDMLFDCNERPKKGIANSRAVIINYADIDKGTSTESGAQVTALTLKSGATGYKLQWYKDLGSANGEYKPNAEEVDGFGHNFLGRLAVTSAEFAERSKELREGRFVVVYETKFQGADQADAFKVLGWESGLELAELTTNTTENGGSILFTLSTKEGEYEDYPFNILYETDYDATANSFEALFSVV